MHVYRICRTVKLPTSLLQRQTGVLFSSLYSHFARPTTCVSVLLECASASMLSCSYAIRSCCAWPPSTVCIIRSDTDTSDNFRH